MNIYLFSMVLLPPLILYVSTRPSLKFQRAYIAWASVTNIKTFVNMCTQSNEYIQYSPVKYAHDFVVLLVLFQMGSYDLYIHIPHNCFIGTEPVVKSVIVNSYENNTPQEVRMTSSTSLHHIQSLFLTLHVATWLIAMDKLIYCFHILQNGPRDCKDVTRPQLASSRIWKYTMIYHAVVSVHRTS